MAKKKIALFSTGWSGQIIYQFASGLCEGLKFVPSDVYFFLNFATYGASKEDTHGEMNIFELPNMEDFDAAVVFANALDYPEIIKKLNKKFSAAGIPVVYTGKQEDGAYFVGSDNLSGTTALTEHLITEHNVKDIWFMAGSINNMDSNSRLSAVKSVLAKHDLEILDQNICYTNWSPYVAFEYVLGRVNNGDKLPDAIICANDTLAMVICSELRKNNYNVPRDTIVTGFDNEFFAQFYDPSISSVDQRFDNIGNKCSEVLVNLFEGKEAPKKQFVSCEFVPSESCGCHSAKDFNAIRRQIGRDKFEDKINASNFDMKLTTIERIVSMCKSYPELIGCFEHLYSNSHDYEGKTIHIVLDPLFKESMQDSQISMRTDGYPDEMHLIYSKDKDYVQLDTMMKTRTLVPQLNPQSENRFYMILPLHDLANSIGYIVFGDDLTKIKESQNLRKYTERFSLILGKFHQSLQLDALNKRLLQLNETDALTHVKNRSAFDNRQSALQSVMCAPSKPHFALGVFDLNNLKQINDSFGHESGDAYITNSCKLICKTFKKSAVYRIGGDEFVVVMENDDYLNRDALLLQLKDEMAKLQGAELPIYEKVSIASGIAVYDPSTDSNISDVFNRADAAMYENKADMKKSMNMPSKDTFEVL